MIKNWSQEICCLTGSVDKNKTEESKEGLDETPKETITLDESVENERNVSDISNHLTEFSILSPTQPKKARESKGEKENNPTSLQSYLQANSQISESLHKKSSLISKTPFKNLVSEENMTTCSSSSLLANSHYTKHYLTKQILRSNSKPNYFSQNSECIKNKYAKPNVSFIHSRNVNPASIKSTSSNPLSYEPNNMHHILKNRKIDMNNLKLIITGQIQK